VLGAWGPEALELLSSSLGARLFKVSNERQFKKCFQQGVLLGIQRCKALAVRSTLPLLGFETET
jgi:hypothetical protein